MPWVLRLTSNTGPGRVVAAGTPLLQALDRAEAHKGAPTAIVAKTVKGKGVHLFENKASYHGVTPNDEELPEALRCLGCCD